MNHSTAEADIGRPSLARKMEPADVLHDVAMQEIESAHPFMSVEQLNELGRRIKRLYSGEPTSTGWNVKDAELRHASYLHARNRLPQCSENVILN